MINSPLITFFELLHVVMQRKALSIYFIGCVSLLLGASFFIVSILSQNWRVNDAYSTPQMNALVRKLNMTRKGDDYTWNIRHGLIIKCLRPDDTRILDFLKKQDSCETIGGSEKGPKKTNKKKQKSESY